VLCAIYGMLQSALLWYKRLQKDLEKENFIFNPYDPCMANQKKNRKQHTICFHVDDLKSSHCDTTINDKFAKWLDTKYGEHGSQGTLWEGAWVSGFWGQGRRLRLAARCAKTGAEVTYDRTNVIEGTRISLVDDKNKRDYLHVVSGTFGSDLGAGLFTR